MTDDITPREDSLTDPTLQEPGELPEPETGNDDTDDTAEPNPDSGAGDQTEEEEDG